MGRREILDSHGDGCYDRVYFGGWDLTPCILIDWFDVVCTVHHIAMCR